MPLIYRRSPDAPSPLHDVEDDIVLSDLVRGTGEASRLRRRGALRVDRVYAGAIPPGRPSRWEVYVPFEEDQDAEPAQRQQSPLQLQQQGQQPPLQPPPQPSLTLPFPVAPPLDLNRDEHDEYTYVLRCGGRSSSSFSSRTMVDPDSSSPPFIPSVLPLYPRPRSGLPHTKPTKHRAPPLTNGCGAVVHAKAAPRPKLGMWTAKTEASCSVVHLDPCYFDSAAVGKMVRSVCGCVREGVGCAIWYVLLCQGGDLGYGLTFL